LLLEMLNLTEARKIYNNNPQDPYVVLPGHNIEVRFSEDGKITAAYDADLGHKPAPQNRWGSQEFMESLAKSRGGLNVVQGQEAEGAAKVGTEKKPEIARKAQRIRLVPDRDL
jgi:hypothetical protein